MIPACVGLAQAAHEHSYGEWIVDRCGALTGIGIRHRVCKGCGESQREIFEGPDHRLSVSILGDSYSTFKDWVPDGAITWYGDPTRDVWEVNDVHEVTNMWWHLLITSLNADLCVNNSYSGTTISDYGYDGEDVQATITCGLPASPFLALASVNCATLGG